jgi:hypothetical protein
MYKLRMCNPNRSLMLQLRCNFLVNGKESFVTVIVLFRKYRLQEACRSNSFLRLIKQFLNNFKGAGKFLFSLDFLD